MKIGQKDFAQYWEIIKTPTLVLIVWSVLGLIVSLISFSLYMKIFSSIAGWVISIAMLAFAGWIAVKDHKENIGVAAWSGALTGAIAGFVGAIISIIMFYTVPQLYELAIQSVVSQGIDAETVRSMLSITIYIGLITGPLISGVVGAILAAITGLIAKKV